MRLAGPALVRFSNVWWRAREWPDLLGVAIAFRVGEGVRKQQRQDLMLATVRRAWTFPWAVATTRWSDFLRNDYYGVARYTARGIGEVDVRARGEGGAGSTASRAERLDEAVRRASAVLRLEVRRLGSRKWVPVVKVEVREPRPEASGVRFDPFRTGAGLEPRGFVHAMRRAVYRASRAGAPVPLASNP